MEDQENSRYIINTPWQPSIIDNSDSIKDTLFDNIKYLDPVSAVSTEYILSEDLKSKGKDIKILENKYDNTYTISSMVYGIEESKLLISLILKDIDASILAPNKEYYIKFNTEDEYQKYSNIYKLVSVNINLTKNNEEFFSPTINANFKGS